MQKKLDHRAPGIPDEKRTMRYKTREAEPHEAILGTLYVIDTARADYIVAECWLRADADMIADALNKVSTNFINAFAVIRKDGTVAKAAFGGPAFYMHKLAEPNQQSALGWAWRKDHGLTQSCSDMPQDFIEAQKAGYQWVPVIILQT